MLGSKLHESLPWFLKIIKKRSLISKFEANFFQFLQEKEASRFTIARPRWSNIVKCKTLENTKKWRNRQPHEFFLSTTAFAQSKCRQV